MTEILRSHGLRLASAEPSEPLADAVFFLLDEPADALHVVPLLQALRRESGVRPVVLCAGAAALRAFEDLVGLSATRLRPDHRTLALEAHAPAERTAAALRAFAGLLEDERPAVVVLAGAGDATLAAALASAKAGVPVLRLDGGLRTGDWSRAEEINRTLIDRLADTLLVSGPAEVQVLEAEGTPTSRVHEVGNLAVDLVDRWRRRAEERAAWTRCGVQPDEYALVVLERRENLADDTRLDALVDALAVTARERPVLFHVPHHAEAAFRRADRPALLRARGLVVVGPLGYVDLLSLKSRAAGVITDSVAVQDELTAIGRRTFTVAATAERLATVTHGTNVLVGEDPASLRDLEFDGHAPADGNGDPIPLWDGCAGIRAADVLVSNHVFARALGLDG